MQHISGFRIETINEIFALLISEEVSLTAEKVKVCPEGHELLLTDKLPE